MPVSLRVKFISCLLLHILDADLKPISQRPSNFERLSTMSTPDQSPLGKSSNYIDCYDPSLLFPLPRSEKRLEIGISKALPFLGADLWTAYELSWLGPRGKPEVALAHISIPCESSHIIESKSFKLYLNSFNNSVFDSAQAVQEKLRLDISSAILKYKYTA